MSVPERPELIIEEVKKAEVQEARSLGHISRKYNHRPNKAIQQLITSDEGLLNAFMEGAIQAEIERQKDK